ncbi:hypothetical protein [Arthrobacter bambusae]|uniref:hypothetical protein n=1 Tax=Arthrobacter bambusae TaxID=1338426 RepID=UPI0027829F08|nr:hypothetical protein [Arthrobacter bambusae]MDQ0241235.1 hypothetical protein [Arthrobacter bambusae]
MSYPDEFDAIHKSLVNDAKRHPEYASNASALYGYSEGAEHALDVVRLKGYFKRRTVSTIDELDALLQGDANVALMDEDGMILQNLAGGWATPISTRFTSSETVHRGFGPDFTVLHEGVAP